MQVEIRKREREERASLTNLKNHGTNIREVVRDVQRHQDATMVYGNSILQVSKYLSRGQSAKED